MSQASQVFNVYLGGERDPRMGDLIALVEKMNMDIQGIKADLDKVTSDLAGIRDAVTNQITAQQAKITDLQSQIDGLKAGDALTEQQINDLKTTADGVASDADATLAAVQPPA